jgi:AraC-like DNA-binding protein
MTRSLWFLTVSPVVVDGHIDPLSRVLSLVTIVEARPSRLLASGAWAVRYEGKPEVSFGYVRRGSVWLSQDGGERRRLDAGDCFVLAGGDAWTLGSDPDIEPGDGAAVCATNEDGTAVIGAGDDVCIEGGQIALDPAGSRLLFAVLPPLTMLRREDPNAVAVREALERFFAEAGSTRLGAALVSGHLGHIICVAALRAALQEPRGWLAAFADPLIGEAVRAVHADPGRRWTVAELAGIAHMATSSFAARFRALTGEGPLAHVLSLRMRVAAAEIRTTNRTIAAIGQELGYSSEASFSRAFKRSVGVAPGRWRAAVAPPLARAGVGRDLIWSLP